MAGGARHFSFQNCSGRTFLKVCHRNILCHYCPLPLSTVGYCGMKDRTVLSFRMEWKWHIFVTLFCWKLHTYLVWKPQTQDTRRTLRQPSTFPPKFKIISQMSPLQFQCGLHPVISVHYLSGWIMWGLIAVDSIHSVSSPANPVYCPMNDKTRGVSACIMQSVQPCTVSSSLQLLVLIGALNCHPSPVSLSPCRDSQGFNSACLLHVTHLQTASNVVFTFSGWWRNKVARNVRERTPEQQLISVIGWMVKMKTYVLTCN